MQIQSEQKHSDPDYLTFRPQGKNINTNALDLKPLMGYKDRLLLQAKKIKMDNQKGLTFIRE